MGILSTQDVKHAFNDLEELEKLNYATLWCPLMIEVIGEK